MKKLYSKGKVILSSNRDRRLNNTTTPDNRTDANLTDRILKIRNQFKSVYS